MHQHLNSPPLIHSHRTVALCFWLCLFICLYFLFNLFLFSVFEVGNPLLQGGPGQDRNLWWQCQKGQTKIIKTKIRPNTISNGAIYHCIYNSLISCFNSIAGGLGIVDQYQGFKNLIKVCGLWKPGVSMMVNHFSGLLSGDHKLISSLLWNKTTIFLRSRLNSIPHCFIWLFSVFNLFVMTCQINIFGANEICRKSDGKSV